MNSGAHPAVGRRTSPQTAPAPGPVRANRGGVASAGDSAVPHPFAYRALPQPWPIFPEDVAATLICVNVGGDCWAMMWSAALGRWKGGLLSRARASFDEREKPAQALKFGMLYPKSDYRLQTLLVDTCHR